mmetsp:Transcript_33161/g.39718  ORF Transcript_33161/g.39718 Transcript_33161/m.39718 type:complete len:115 (+) Transcript_33161:187-531(+)
MVLSESVNLARRLSTSNENDMLQERVTDARHSHRECKIIAAKVANIQGLPSECHQYNDVISAVPKPADSSDLSIAFQGMGSSAAASIKARKTGKQNYAQIQRRYTNTRRFSNGK